MDHFVLTKTFPDGLEFVFINLWNRFAKNLLDNLFAQIFKSFFHN